MKNKAKSDGALYQLADRYVQIYGGQLMAEQDNLAGYGQEPSVVPNPKNWIKTLHAKEKWRAGGRIAIAGISLLAAAVIMVTAMPLLSLKTYDSGGRLPERDQAGPPSSEDQPETPVTDNAIDFDGRQAETVYSLWNQLAQAAGYTVTESTYDSEHDIFFFRLTGDGGEILATAEKAIDSSELDPFDRQQVDGRTIFIGMSGGKSVLIYQPLNRAYIFEGNAGPEGLLDFFSAAAPFLDSMID